MVEIPKFWYKVVPVKLEDAASGEGQQIAIGQWIIADRPMETYKVHPAFIRNGKEVDRIYVGAFEACLYDTSAGVYDTDDSITMDTAADVLCSISGVKPAGGYSKELSLINSRTLAQNKGTGYGIIDFTVISAIQLLLLIEYASFDSQSCAGHGIVNLSDGATNMALNTSGDSAVIYRGIENFWGNIWSWVDGINIEANSLNYAYWSNDNYVSSTSDNYTKINFKLCCNDGYVDRFGYDENSDFVFLPTRATGSTSVAPHDYYYQNNTYSDWLAGRLGGRWNDISKAGCWCWFLSNDPSYYFRSIGARLQFYK